MITDIWTVATKEWQEILLQRGMRRGWVNLAVLVAVFGVFLPLQVGVPWLRSPLAAASWAWVPIMLVVNVIADSFAGERERHTLETLLASRLPDRAILFGKALAAVAYGWGVALVSLGLGLVTVNVAHSQGRLLFYAPIVALGGVTVSLLVSAVAAGAGILVSLRAPTVRQAQQTLGVATLLLVWVPIIGMSLVPKELSASAGSQLATINAGLVLAVGAIALVAVDVILMAAAMARFKRAELILD